MPGLRRGAAHRRVAASLAIAAGAMTLNIYPPVPLACASARAVAEPVEQQVERLRLGARRRRQHRRVVTVHRLQRWYRSGTIDGMATNLRLRPESEDAVRAEAQRSGRSQQEVIREAVDRYLGLAPDTSPSGELDSLVASGAVRPPRVPYRRPRRRLPLSPGVTSADLLDRDERI